MTQRPGCTPESSEYGSGLLGWLGLGSLWTEEEYE
jgi:hypothetical protein